jgi:hypothetical protein
VPSTCSGSTRERWTKPTSSRPKRLPTIATIAISQHRAVLEARVVNEQPDHAHNSRIVNEQLDHALNSRIVNEQLDHALNSRIVIEQAGGVLAERAGVDMERAFARLRARARHHNLRLVDVARDVLSSVLPTGSLDTPRLPHRG